MKRAGRNKLERLVHRMKQDYHELSDLLVDDDFMRSGVRGDKLKAAFTLQDLAICEINEVLGKPRSD